MDLGPALKKVDLLGPQLFNERSERGNGVVRGQQRVEALERAIGGTIVSRDKEVNNQRNLLIQNHRVAKSVHEILPLKYFGFSITSK
jgi:hypothetical protein